MGSGSVRPFASAGAGGRWVEFTRRLWIATSMRNLAAVAMNIAFHFENTEHCSTSHCVCGWLSFCTYFELRTGTAAGEGDAEILNRPRNRHAGVPIWLRPRGR